jgi:hypothetical protein
MANKDADKDKKAKPHGQAKDHKDHKPPKPESKDKDKEKAKKAKEKEKAAAEAAAAAPPEPKVEAPREPADPRLKFVKKFRGKFLPRGPLRDRHTALFARWNGGDDHGGVTVDELKSLYVDWRATKEKPARKKAAV